MKIKEINKVEGRAMATLYSGGVAQVHCRAVEVGSNTVTPINSEDATVVFKAAIEYYEDGAGTGVFEVLNSEKFIKKVSELPTTDLSSPLIVEYFVDEVCGLHIAEEPTQ